MEITKKFFLGASWIGIDNANANWVNTNLAAQSSKAAYAYDLTTGTKRAWNVQMEDQFISTISILCTLAMGGIYKNSYIITLIFESTLHSACLKCKINEGKEFFIAKNVTRERGLKYRLTIFMYSESHSVELLK